MINDIHIHIHDLSKPSETLINNMDKADIENILLLSYGPFEKGMDIKDISDFNNKRLDNLFEWKEKDNRIYGFYFINPTEDNAMEQVETAVKAGVDGFKVICYDHYPGDERAIPVYKKIAEYAKPMLFHSGILWNRGPSAIYNRPGNFEELLKVPGLRFALAHVGWPWHDELIALFGKILNAERHGWTKGQKMYIDLTPGTPPIYRKEVLYKLLKVGYKGIEKRMIFGSDNTTENYDEKWIDEWKCRDKAIYDELEIGEDIQNDIFCNNFFDFIKGT